MRILGSRHGAATNRRTNMTTNPVHTTQADQDHETLMKIRDRLSARTVDAGAARDVIDILLRAGFRLMDPTTDDFYKPPGDS
jgi:hypothetical protein